MTEVVAISPHSVLPYWPEVSGLLGAALRHGRSRFTLDRVQDDLIAGKKRLWVVMQGETLVSAVVTCITDFPAKRVCTILLCGGEDADAWVAKVLSAVEEYAAWEECGQVEIIGRPGWQRKCPDYELAGTWLVKELSR
jgi:hypothetical protein